MITLDVARAFNKSDINPVMIAPLEKLIKGNTSCKHAWISIVFPDNVAIASQNNFSQSMFSSLSINPS